MCSWSNYITHQANCNFSISLQPPCKKFYILMMPPLLPWAKSLEPTNTSISRAHPRHCQPQSASSSSLDFFSTYWWPSKFKRHCNHSFWHYSTVLESPRPVQSPNLQSCSPNWHLIKEEKKIVIKAGYNFYMFLYVTNQDWTTTRRTPVSLGYKDMLRGVPKIVLHTCRYHQGEWRVTKLDLAQGHGFPCSVFVTWRTFT